MGPKAGGTKIGCGMVGAISPMYQGTATIKPISVLRCPEAGFANIKRVMISSRNFPPCPKNLLPVKFFKYGPSLLIVPDFIYCLNTGQIV